MNICIRHVLWQKGLSQVMSHKLCVNCVAKGRKLTYALILQFASSKTCGRNCFSLLFSKLDTFEGFRGNRNSEAFFLIYWNFQVKTWNYKKMQKKQMLKTLQSCFSQNVQNRVTPFCHLVDDMVKCKNIIRLAIISSAI